MQKKTSDIGLESNSTRINLIGKNGIAIPIPELVPGHGDPLGEMSRGWTSDLSDKTPK